MRFKDIYAFTIKHQVTPGVTCMASTTLNTCHCAVNHFIGIKLLLLPPAGQKKQHKPKGASHHRRL